ncbi:MAG: hypothetical protein ACR2LK_15790 [Solirubrobacteraceae bacterium]
MTAPGQPEEPEQQRGSGWCKTAAPSEITGALARGELSELLRGADPDARQPAPEPVEHTPEAIANMSPSEIVERARAGDADLARRLPSLHQHGTDGTADQGARGETQTLREQLRTMSPDAIVKAHRAGDLDELLRGDGPEP